MVLSIRNQLLFICGVVIVLGVLLIWLCFKLDRNEKFSTAHPKLPNVIGFFGWFIVLVGASGILMCFTMVAKGNLM